MAIHAFSVVLLGALAVAGASTKGLRGRSLSQLEMLTDMHPEIVSQFLSEVESQWTAGSVAAKSGKSEEAFALKKMQESCAKVSNSILAGSDGDKDKVDEYMNNVCSQDKDGSEAAKRCNKFGDALLAFMNADTEFNRDELDTAKFCAKYYKDVVEVEAAQEVKLLAEEAKLKAEKDAAAKKKADEEAAKKAALEKKEAYEKSKALAKEEELKSLKAVREAEAAEDAAIKFSGRTEKTLKVQEENMKEAELSAEKLRVRARKELELAEKKDLEEKKKAAVRAVLERENARRMVEEAKLAAAKAKAAKEAEEAKKAEDAKKQAEEAERKQKETETKLLKKAEDAKKAKEAKPAEKKAEQKKTTALLKK